MFGDYQFTLSLSVNLPFPTLPRRTIKNGATIRKMPEQPVVLNVKTIGGRGNLHWFLDKMWVGKVRNSQTVKIEVPSIGEHTISVIDDKGAFSKSVFSVE